MDLRNIKICIIGLGYVGLPLALEFGKKRETLGFDINQQRIKELQQGLDKTHEKTNSEILGSKFLKFSYLEHDLKKYNCYIISVPTPIDELKLPNLNPLKDASKKVSKYLKKNDLVVYESTVYPGCTEEICVPILEEGSKLKYNKDFFCGYSPERINPGDKEHKITDIQKVTSGSDVNSANIIDEIYKQIIPAGTHKAKSIKIAEAAKIIENTQRDLNIALINELSMLFKDLEIDTEEVLKAAETKWNFNSYRPGLVGGHCISVDPYYLTYKAKQINFKPEIILAGRKINDNMPNHICKTLINYMNIKKMNSKKANILIMGLSFKENCSDLRNTQVINLYKILSKESSIVDIYDPMIREEDAFKAYKIKLINNPKFNFYDAIIVAVAHNIFKELGLKNIKKYCKSTSIIYDLKYLLDKEDSDLRL
tara:strand:+ start:14831 stop:16105 length:1275 start_codon:yes stop_codon:yes gene_type:complete